MNAFFAQWRRELAAHFLSPLGYVAMVFFLAVMGVSFYILAAVLAEGAESGAVLRILFGESPFFWLALLIVVPVITMRLFAEEKRSGTIETLMTAPVTDAAVVLAKYLGAMSFFVALCSNFSSHTIISFI